MHTDQPTLTAIPDQVAWQKYCGFLDLSLPAFMQVQRRKLTDALPELLRSEIGHRLIGSDAPVTPERFRREVPLSSFEDYLSHFDGSHHTSMPQPPVFWARTSRRNAEQTLIPYSQVALDQAVDATIGAFMLGSSSGPGELSLNPGDQVLYNLPPMPFLSGALAPGIADKVNMRSVLDFQETEGMDFHDKISAGFDRALDTGVDLVVSMTSVLVKMGESFEDGSRTSRGGKLKRLTRPRAAVRLLRGLLRSKRAGRRLLPKDLWSPKGLICWGTDTDVYREELRRYWGVDPFEFLAISEGGVLAMQAWNRQGMTFLPFANYLEFLPEHVALQSDGGGSAAHLETVLMDQVEPGVRYEVVITSCNGMPFVRYRTGVLVEVTSLRDTETGVQLPQFKTSGRAHDIIDVAGFTRLDETTLARAIKDVGLASTAWTARKEYNLAAPSLTVYVEDDGRPAQLLAEGIHRALLGHDQYYRDLESMLGIHPLRVVVLNGGAFRAFYRSRRARGFPLADIVMPRINASDAELDELLEASAAMLEPVKAMVA